MGKRENTGCPPQKPTRQLCYTSSRPPSASFRFQQLKEYSKKVLVFYFTRVLLAGKPTPHTLFVQKERRNMLYPIQNEFRNKFDLSGIWDFCIDPEEKGEENDWFNGLEQGFRGGHASLELCRFRRCAVRGSRGWYELERSVHAVSSTEDGRSRFA